MSTAVDGRTAPALCMERLSFAYPGPGQEPVTVVARDLSWEVPQGAFALLVGATGSGKTTLLRLAKPEVAPVGIRTGRILLFGREAASLRVGDSAGTVGYVFQNPSNQIVCDTVWHELAFGLENLGLGQEEMRQRMAEVCIFLGIEPLFRRRCSELSGGQRQVVALAAVLAMRPRLLLLDEPTAMLDPVCAKEFLALLFRANRELGITVVVATHEPAPMTDYATCAFELRDGAVHEVALEGMRARAARAGGSRTLAALPASAQERLVLDDLWLRYDRSDPWVLRGCDLRVRAGEVRALVGGNGSGKSTLLAAAAGIVRPQRGKVRTARGLVQALLPQEPKALLGCETVANELAEWSQSAGYGAADVQDALVRLGLADRTQVHPYDLSGGQQQLLALEKLLLTRPQLLLLDEPTKGLDHEARERLAARVRTLAAEGCSVLVATHDMAFVRSVAHAVSLLFDGQAGAAEDVDGFFARSWMWRA